MLIVYITEGDMDDYELELIRSLMSNITWDEDERVWRINKCDHLSDTLHELNELIEEA